MQFVPICSTVSVLIFGGLYLAIAVYLIYCIHRLRVEAEEQSLTLREIRDLLRPRQP